MFITTCMHLYFFLIERILHMVNDNVNVYIYESFDCIEVYTICRLLSHDSACVILTCIRYIRLNTAMFLLAIDPLA